MNVPIVPVALKNSTKESYIESDADGIVTSDTDIQLEILDGLERYAKEAHST